MPKAEEITKNYGISKLKIISGVGVREYYKKLGYELEGTYMVKNLNEKYH
jgi:elongator complex protein 3